jgi:signal transduction histidine kinase
MNEKSMPPPLHHRPPGTLHSAILPLVSRWIGNALAAGKGWSLGLLLLAHLLPAQWDTHRSELERLGWDQPHEAHQRLREIDPETVGWSVPDRIRFTLFSAEVVWECEHQAAAIALLDRALEELAARAGGTGDPLVRGLWADLQSRRLAFAGQHGEAAALSAEAVTILRGIGPGAREDLASALAAAIYSHHILDEAEAARAAYREARALYTELDDPLAIAAIDSSAHLVDWSTAEERALAARRLREAAAFFRAEGLVSGILYTSHALIGSSRLLEEDALALLEEIEPIVARYGTPPVRLMQLRARFDLLDEETSLEEKLALSRRLVLTATDFGESEQALWYSLSLAELLSRRGAPGDAEEAARLAHRGVEEATRQGDDFSGTRARQILAEGALARQDPAAGLIALAPALEFLRAHAGTYPENLVEALALQSRLLRAVGRDDHAYEALAEAFSIHRDAFGAEYYRRLADTSAGFRDEFRDNQLRVVELESALSESRLEAQGNALAQAEAERLRALQVRNLSLAMVAVAAVCLLIVVFFLRVRQRNLRELTALNRSFREEKEALARALAREAEAKLDLLDLNRRLKEVDEERREILGHTAHDLRNPASAIETSLELLETELEEAHPAALARVAPILSTAREGSRHLLELIAGILRAHADEARPSAPHLRRVPLEPIMRQMLEINRSGAEAKGMSFKLSSTPGLTVLADPVLLGSAVDNLLSNAVKFSPLGSLIDVEIVPHGAEELAVHIRDAGPGIPADEFDQLFKPFARLSNQPTGGEPSSGLGLSSVARAMASMGGRVSARNRAEGGACFSLFLPREPESAES